MPSDEEYLRLQVEADAQVADWGSGDSVMAWLVAERASCRQFLRTKGVTRNSVSTTRRQLEEATVRINALRRRMSRARAASLQRK